MATHTSRRNSLEHVRVGDCMHHGILGCAADAPLSEVAGVMAEHRIHAVALNTADGRPPLAVVSDLDVVSAAASGGYPPAIQAAATEPLAVSADETLLRAAQLMTEHGVSHLVVLSPTTGHPSGILSSLDLAAAYAGGGVAES